MTISKAFLQTFILALFITIAGILGSAIGLFLKYQEYSMPLLSAIFFMLSYWLFYKIILRRKPEFNDISFLKINHLHIFPIIITAIGLKLFEQPIYDLLRPLIVSDEFKNVIQNTQFRNRELTFTFVFNAISALIIAPIFEELFFRKYLLNHLLLKNTVRNSIVISSICFSLLHLPNYLNLIPTFLMGLILGCIMTKTKNTSLCVLFHFTFNLIVTLLKLYGKHLYENLHNFNYNKIYWLLCLLGIVFIWLGLKSLLKQKLNRTV
ncbi:CPBP family intramembrane glutamic endopeptidase [Epilithonimonas xixisoli]|uniref:CAAX prenyl protease-like protein n=1 Tax=Epilithonimonas xixisoli TaxID=1476462 RepID=A0A4R8I6U0_9FLAO|nr:type II CAAX endopeptidase family protein [Epilithonimonas xixisoli]TDX84349.1 CAAX prenyl protease-like protein [Epilithonimonas xixisoli]